LNAKITFEAKGKLSFAYTQQQMKQAIILVLKDIATDCSTAAKAHTVLGFVAFAFDIICFITFMAHMGEAKVDNNAIHRIQAFSKLVFVAGFIVMDCYAVFNSLKLGRTTLGTPLTKACLGFEGDLIV
jgi:hypothetical protein